MNRRTFCCSLIITILSAFIKKESSANTQKKGVKKIMPVQYEARDYSKLLGMEGFSDTLLNNHFTLYKGYVTNTNTLASKIHEMFNAGNDRTPEYAELKRRFGFEFDGMRLHEFYFENLGGNGEPNSTSELYKKIEQDFGSFDSWKKDFISTGVMRGIGWVMLYEDPENGSLMNCWIGEHQENHPAGCLPILVMDVWEHAFMLDYGLNRAGYIESFFKNIDWSAVEKRYK